MTLDVSFSYLGLTPGDVAGRPVAVIDVLRATTTINVALDSGARAVVVAADAGEATMRAQVFDRSDVVLAGERNCDPIPGFHLGNSPGDMTPEAVAGKTLVFTTTNGTRALLATAGAREVVLAAAVNLSAAGAWAREQYLAHGDLLILCAGRDLGFGMDDAYLAGLLAVEALGGRRSRKGLNDAAMVSVDLVRRYGDRIDRVLALSGAGRQLSAQGYEADLVAASQRDIYPNLPIYHDRRVTLGTVG